MSARSERSEPRSRERKAALSAFAFPPDLDLAAVPGQVRGRFIGIPLPGAIDCHGQLVALPAGRYDWLHLRTACPETVEATVWLHYAGGLDPERWPVPAGDLAPSRLPVTRRDELLAIRLPRHDALRLLSLRLVTPGDMRCPVTPGDMRCPVTPGDMRCPVTPGEVR